MSGEIVKQEPKPLTPGLGVAGQVICAKMSITHTVICQKSARESWVELKYGDTSVCRCANSSVPVMLSEVRASVDKLREALNANNDKK